MATKKKSTAKKGRPAQKASAVAQKKNPEDTQFKPGNKIWRLRKSHNQKPRAFDSPESLWQAACSYFEWVENNPILEERIFCQQGEIIRDYISKPRAMTIAAMSLHMGICRRTLEFYRKRDEFVDVVSAIDDVLWSQKFELAAADQMNAMIVARELGLKDSASHEHTGKDGGPIETADMTDFEKARRIAFYLAQAANKMPE